MDLQPLCYLERFSTSFKIVAMVWTREDLHGMLGSPTYDWDLNGESNLTTYLDHNPSSLNSAAKIEFWIVFTNYHTHTHTQTDSVVNSAVLQAILLS